MGDMGDFYNDVREADKVRRWNNHASADPTGWTQHSDVHWSRDLNGHRLDYWPTRNKFRYRNRTMTGDVLGFIRKRTDAKT